MSALSEKTERKPKNWIPRIENTTLYRNIHIGTTKIEKDSR